MPKQSQAEIDPVAAEITPDCPHCHKPPALCICDSITPIENRVSLLLLRMLQEQQRNPVFDRRNAVADAQRRRLVAVRTVGRNLRRNGVDLSLGLFGHRPLYALWPCASTSQADSGLTGAPAHRDSTSAVHSGGGRSCRTSRFRAIPKPRSCLLPARDRLETPRMPRRILGIIEELRMRVAIIGTGIAGNAAAWALSKRYPITVYDRELRPGGHSHTVTLDYDGTPLAVDIGFIVYNELNYPDLTALFAHLGVETVESCMSFAVTADAGRFEWKGGGETGSRPRSACLRSRRTFCPRPISGCCAISSLSTSKARPIMRRPNWPG